jgi:hypothetical protein
LPGHASGKSIPRHGFPSGSYESRVSNDILALSSLLFLASTAAYFFGSFLKLLRMLDEQVIDRLRSLEPCDITGAIARAGHAQQIKTPASPRAFPSRGIGKPGALLLRRLVLGRGACLRVGRHNRKA